MYGQRDLRLQKYEAGRYGFTAMRVEQLRATEFTLVNLAVDASGSNHGYKRQLEALFQRIVGAFVGSDRRHHILLRLVAFDQTPHEVHGFKPLSECDPADYCDLLFSGGTTAVTDAALNGIEALRTFGRHLKQIDFAANGLWVVLGDGMDNCSVALPAELKDAQDEARKLENLESLTSILVRICDGVPQEVREILYQFKEIAGFTKHLDLRDMTDATMTQLADYIVGVINAVVDALGTGKPPRQLPHAGSLEGGEGCIPSKKSSRAASPFAVKRPWKRRKG